MVIGAAIFFAGWLFVILPMWHAERDDAINAFSALAMALLTVGHVLLNFRLARSTQEMANVTRQAMLVVDKAMCFETPYDKPYNIGLREKSGRVKSSEHESFLSAPRS